MFIGGMEAEAEAPLFAPLHAKSWLIRRDPDAGKYCESREKRGNRRWNG